MKSVFSRILNKIQSRLRHHGENERLERGQVLVIVTLSVIGLVAAVGLTVDVAPVALRVRDSVGGDVGTFRERGIAG